ncbi:MAG TPA: TonB-dependent receptor [Cyclobacteriaceae bacterium]|jgi:iron complex outermembrane receptor protein
MNLKQKFYQTLFLLILNCTFVYSQNTYQATIQDKTTQEPLIGVSVFIPELSKGNISDKNGSVIITNIPDGVYQVQFSYIGYQTLRFQVNFPLADSLNNNILYLLPIAEEMEEVTISSTRSTRTIEDIPTRVEFIAGEELAEKGNMKPGDIRMMLNESTGIQTQQTSATSYNSSIRIQGLDGKYTQLLRDGLPLYSGFSSGLSLMQIAPLDLKQVEVIKGATSTLYGGGAIAGLVNLVSKTPRKESELSFMLNGTSALGLDASSFYSRKFKRFGATVFTSYNLGSPYDPANIGLTAIPKFDRFTFNPKLFVYLNDKSDFNIGLNLITEDRLGGNIDYVKGTQTANAYYEENETTRISTQISFEHRISTRSKIGLKNSYSNYDRKISIPNFTFAGVQNSSFTELNYLHFSDRMEWVLGLNLWTDHFDQSTGSAGSPLDYQNATVGAFIQNIWKASNKISLETGFRIDYHSEYEFFALPRLSFMYKPVQSLTLRVGGGLGYKTPTIFSEEAERIQFRNVLPLSVNDPDAEQSMGTNLDVNYRLNISKELLLTANILGFYTNIENPVVLIQNNQSFFEFQQPDGNIDTKGAEVNLKLSYHDFKLFVGYTFADVNEHYNGITTKFPLVAKHRLNNVLMFEKEENLWVGFEAYYFSPQKLSDGLTGQSYWILGLMSEKMFGEHFSIFLNLENFLDTRQTRFDTIFTGTPDNPQFRDIYAPVDGFVINAGFKLKF